MILASRVRCGLCIWVFFGRFLSSGTRLTECQQCGSSTYSTHVLYIRPYTPVPVLVKLIR